MPTPSLAQDGKEASAGNGREFTHSKKSAKFKCDPLCLLLLVPSSFVVEAGYGAQQYAVLAHAHVADVVGSTEGHHSGVAVHVDRHPRVVSDLHPTLRQDLSHRKIQ